MILSENPSESNQANTPREPFFRVPASLLARDDISCAAKMVAAVVADLATRPAEVLPFRATRDGDSLVSIGIRTLAGMVGLSPARADEAIREAEAAGLLVIRRAGSNGRGLTNAYGIPAGSSARPSGRPAERAPAGTDDSARPSGRRAPGIPDGGRPAERAQVHTTDVTDTNKGAPPSAAAAAAPPAGVVQDIPSSEQKRRARRTAALADPWQFALECLPLAAPHREHAGFRAAWLAWAEHRRERRSPLTRTSATLQLRDLSKMTVADAVAALERATLNGWQGLHPGSGAGRNGTPQDSPARVRGTDWEAVIAAKRERGEVFGP